jgi:hypothetical protein
MESTGTLRDMISTHLFQLLGFVALDPVGAQNSLTPADLLPSRRRQPGMIRRWRYV